MIKYFCNRCQKEILWGDSIYKYLRTIGVGEEAIHGITFNGSGIKVLSTDICEKCKNILDEFIRTTSSTAEQ